MKRFVLEHDRKKRTAYAQKSSEGLWIHIDGRTRLIPKAEGGRKRASVVKSSNEILAPMPGKIIQVLKKKGDTVLIGEPIVVMEAMKMEYTLKAEIESKVEDIFVGESDQVALGQVLVKLEKPN